MVLKLGNWVEVNVNLNVSVNLRVECWSERKVGGCG